MVRRGGVRLLLAVIAMVALLAATAPVPASPGTANAQVQVSNFQFQPSTVTIQPGQQVTWTWASGTHNVQTRDGTETWCATRSSGSCDRVFSTPGTFDYRCGIHPSSMLATVIVEGTAPTVTIDTPADGGAVDDLFTTSGTASHPGGITAVAWRIDASAYTSVDALEPGPEAAWSATIDPSGLAAGTHTLTVRATAADGTTGTASISFAFDAPDQVDVRVASFTTTGGPQRATLTAAGHNAGTVDVVGTRVAFEYLYHGTWRPIGDSVVDLPAGATRVRSVVWEADGKIGSFDVRAVIDPDDVIAEHDETNNVRQGSVAFVHSAIPGTDPSEPF